MKKTLLIAAAALAAGVISTQAQVYSQNIVGYVNTAIPGNGALSLIVNPMQNITGGVTNNAGSVLSALVGGETLYTWTGSGYNAYVYAGSGVGTGLGYSSDFYDGNPGTGAAIPGTTYDSNNGVYWTPALKLDQGKAFYISNPGSSITNAFVGNAITQNTNTPVAIAGNGALSLTGSTVPIGGNVTNLTLPFVGGETILAWTGAGYYAYIYAGPGVGTGLGYASDYYDGNPGTGAAIPGTTYDSNNGVYWAPPLNVGVGSGFFVSNPGSAVNWTQVVNP